MELNDLVTQLGALAGFGALVAVVVNLLKQAGVVADGQAGTWSAGLNLVGLVALFVLRVFAPAQDVGQLDGVAAGIAQALQAVAALVIQLGGAKAAHALLRGVPAVGKSYSAQ